MFPSDYPEKQTAAFSPSKEHSPFAESKRALGLYPDALHLVVLAAEPGDFLPELLSFLYVCDDHDSNVSLLCTGNSTLFQQLHETLGYLDTFHLYDDAEKASLLFDSADLLLTEGQAPVLSEVLKRRLFLVLIGSDGKNEPCSCLIRKGCAVAARETVQLAEICIKLLDNEGLRAKMSGAYLR